MLVKVLKKYKFELRRQKIFLFSSFSGLGEGRAGTIPSSLSREEVPSLVRAHHTSNLGWVRAREGLAVAKDGAGSPPWETGAGGGTAAAPGRTKDPL